MPQENNERQTDFEEIAQNTYVTVGVAKLVSNVRDAVHDIDNFSHNMYVYDNQMLPCDILGAVGDMAQLVEKLQLRLSQLATVAATFDEIWDYSQDYRRDEYKNATQALPTVESIDENGETYDIESPTTMRDLA